MILRLFSFNDISDHEKYMLATCIGFMFMYMCFTCKNMLDFAITPINNSGDLIISLYLTVFGFSCFLRSLQHFLYRLNKIDPNKAQKLIQLFMLFINNPSLISLARPLITN